MTECVREFEELGVRIRHQDDFYIVETRDFLGDWIYTIAYDESKDELALRLALNAFRFECHRQLDLLI